MNIEVEVEADDWLHALPGCEALVTQAALAAFHSRESGDPGLFIRKAGMSEESGSLTILLTSDAEVRALNRIHRRQDKPTNVLSFPAHATALGHLGDLALAYETCAREAAAQDKPLADHLRHLVVHGTLHLLGDDHADDRAADAMEARERVILATLGVPDPYLTAA